MDYHHASSPNPTAAVHVNVGGALFTTTLATLTKHPESYLASMFASPAVTLPIDQKDGSYFVDRSGAHFDLILDYLRSGTLTVPRSPVEYSNLRREICYYGLPIAAQLPPQPPLLWETAPVRFRHARVVVDEVSKSVEWEEGKLPADINQRSVFEIVNFLSQRGYKVAAEFASRGSRGLVSLWLTKEEQTNGTGVPIEVSDTATGGLPKSPEQNRPLNATASDGNPNQTTTGQPLQRSPRGATSGLYNSGAGLGSAHLDSTSLGGTGGAGGGAGSRPLGGTRGLGDGGLDSGDYGSPSRVGQLLGEPRGATYQDPRATAGQQDTALAPGGRFSATAYPPQSQNPTTAAAASPSNNRAVGGGGAAGGGGPSETGVSQRTDGLQWAPGHATMPTGSYPAGGGAAPGAGGQGTLQGYDPARARGPSVGSVAYPTSSGYPTSNPGQNYQNPSGSQNLAAAHPGVSEEDVMRAMEQVAVANGRPTSAGPAEGVDTAAPSPTGGHGGGHNAFGQYTPSGSSRAAPPSHWSQAMPEMQ